MPWTQAVVTVVDRMINHISDRRELYSGKRDRDVVPWVKQLVTKRWKMTAAYVVKEITARRGEFKINEVAGDDSEDERERPVGEEEVVVPQGPAQVLKPQVPHCSCGKWQEFQIPCRHAIAYYRHWGEHNLDWIMENVVDDIWRMKTLKTLYEPNLYPVMLHNIRPDGITEPPAARRQAGRPKQNRFRARTQKDGMTGLAGSGEGKRDDNDDELDDDEALQFI